MEVAKNVEFSHEGIEYKLLPSKSGTMEKAKNTCAGYDMIVYEPRNSSSYDFVIRKALDQGMSRIWLNMGREDPDSPFHYLSDKSEPLQWKNWATYEPNNHENQGENCVQTHWHLPWQTLWMDIVCVSDGNIVCQSNVQ